MVSSTLCPAVHILGSQNVYGRAEGITDHYWPWAVFLSLFVSSYLFFFRFSLNFILRLGMKPSICLSVFFHLLPSNCLFFPSFQSDFWSVCLFVHLFLLLTLFSLDVPLSLPRTRELLRRWLKWNPPSTSTDRRRQRHPRVTTTT